jgi:hypothetical protein
LREKKYTIEGAKKILSNPTELKNILATDNNENITVSTSNNKSNDIKADLLELRNFLVDLRSKI